MTEARAMRTLITGATGFLGAALAQRLLAEGLPVRILARVPDRARVLIDQGAEYCEGDIGDEAALAAALDDVAVVYHLAGKLFIPGVPDAEYEHIHVAGTRKLLELCRARPDLRRFVHCGTTGVLGVTGTMPADENAPYGPTNAYERTKLAGELLVRAAAQAGLPAVIVRPGLVYGPGDLHLLGFFRSIQSGMFRPIGRRPIWLHPIYIDDMTEAFVRCARDPRAIGECFHIAGREPATIATLAATIARAIGVAPRHGRIPLPAARMVAAMGDALPAGIRQRAPLTRSRLDFLTNSRVYNVEKARQLLDFSADTDLASGIARTAAWYRAEGYL